MRVARASPSLKVMHHSLLRQASPKGDRRLANNPPAAIHSSQSCRLRPGSYRRAQVHRTAKGLHQCQTGDKVQISSAVNRLKSSACTQAFAACAACLSGDAVNTEGLVVPKGGQAVSATPAEMTFAKHDRGPPDPSLISEHDSPASSLEARLSIPTDEDASRLSGRLTTLSISLSPASQATSDALAVQTLL